uniref:Leucine-rich repeat protein n=1 Tax=Paramoeba aestuarina TaxID=180227 RepID=A0A7S4N577_9EUKA
MRFFALRIIMSFVIVMTADLYLGKVDKSTFPQQTLMEMLVNGFTAKNRLIDEMNDYKDIENWAGVKFNDIQEVIVVEWRDFQRLHFPDGGTLEIRWLPPTVEIFALTGSNMEGTLETSLLPQVMYKLYIQRNKLSGTVDLSRMPPKMSFFVVHTNAFSGSLRMTNLPDSLESLLLFRNRFSGPLVVANLPEKFVAIVGETSIGDIVDEKGELLKDPRVTRDLLAYA